MTHDLPTVCPWCKTRNEAVTDAEKDDATPRHGDISLCIRCGEWAVFDSFWVGGMRKPNHAEYVEIVDNPLSHEMRRAWLMVQEELKNALETRSQSHRRR